jgi:hypothetical protein
MAEENFVDKYLLPKAKAFAMACSLDSGNKTGFSKFSPLNADVVEVVRCKDCVHAVELDKHCDISRTAYRHCGLLRGEEIKNVWHKYKKYYKDYSIVSLDGFCDEGELKEREGK